MADKDGNILAKEETAMSEKNYGIDALRILAMFMVTILHILNREAF